MRKFVNLYPFCVGDDAPQEELGDANARLDLSALGAAADHENLDFAAITGVNYTCTDTLQR